ncbi:MAG: glycosyltransferase family 4 protein, partial [Actinobacteria bacterium]|nr:glycosyltransferase family 4 protein [Actinomycetota bacterium]
MRPVYFVMPDGIDDPVRASGGNTYDRHLRRELGACGWTVHDCAVAGFWDRPDAASFEALAATLRQIPDDAVVLLDGLIASTAPQVLSPHAGRVRLVVLVHMPLGHRPRDGAARRREGAALALATAVVTTSGWTRDRLAELYGPAADRVRVAEPGVEGGAAAPGSATGEALLCVGPVSFEKGHDILLEALASISAPAWHCTCVGSLDRDPAFAQAFRQRSQDAGLDRRISLPGPWTEDDLGRGYAAADLLVVASRAETYGMVVTEALA